MTIDRGYRPGSHFDVCLAAATTTLKYDVARQLRKPVVTVGWLRASAQGKRLVALDRFMVPPFLGCVVSITGFMDLTHRERLKLEVEQNGGTFSPDLVQGKCTHLIALKPEGGKYESALKWGIRIVSQKWLDDCVRAKANVGEACYPVVQQRVVAPEVAKWVPPQLLEDDTPWDSNHLFGCRLYMVGFDAHERETRNQEKKNLMHEDTFEKMKLVRQGAGITTKDMNKATHIVISEHASAVDYYRVRMERDRCVTAAWLVACARESKCLPMEDYLIEDKIWAENVNKTISNRRTDSGIQSTRSLSSERRDEIEEGNRGNRTSRLNPGATQDIRQPEIVTRDQNPLARENLSRVQVPETSKMTGTELPATEPIRFDRQDESGQPTSDSIPFVGKRIALSPLLQEDEASAARDYIGQGGGSVIDSRTGREFMNADYMVCPSMPSADERRTLRKMALGKMELVTCFWLDECLKQSCILSPENSVAFKPLPCDVPIPGLSGGSIRMSTSNYTEDTKREIRMMCVLVDAKYSDQLSRAKNTHLLSPVASGKKYEAAMNWGLKVATREWLETCIKSGKLVDESEFKPKSGESNAEPAAGETHAGIQAAAKKAFAPQVVGKDLSGLLQPSASPLHTTKPSTPSTIAKSSPSGDSRMPKSTGSRGKTPLSRTASGVTPGSKRLKTLTGRPSAGEQTEALFDQVMQNMEPRDENTDMPKPLGFPTPVNRSTVTRTAKNAMGASSLQLSQMDNKHETQFGYADYKQNSPRTKSEKRPDGNDKLNTLFATHNNASARTPSQGDNQELDDWI